MSGPESEHVTADRVEAVMQHPQRDGPVVLRLTNIEPGENTFVVTVVVSSLRKAIETDLADSYGDVFLWTDGKRIAVTDHRSPIDPSDEEDMSDFTGPVVRADVVCTPDEAQRFQAPRDQILTALGEFDDDDEVDVMIETAWPAFFAQGGEGVGVAPVVKPGEEPGRKGANKP